MPDDTPTPDEVWRLLTHVVMDTRDAWKRAVIERTGLPFSRIRILRRLRGGPLTVKELAHAATMDAPATTVAVNDLEERGLVVREIDAGNRRRKLVSLTEAGREVVAVALATPDPAPPRVAELSAAELRALRDVLHKLEQ
ncbi:MarR family winged helix-turn-helix transcriptional regulator [Nocardia crassostreae]|uniref:MarR family winged helix-turn-helix transcriptional regulator n=1 Tax=Nocardia crassostreae TaxID=53428 RepID=UPI00082D2FBC|nr:MarR family transcriptional regulator [Nocardia crassostreae]